MNVNSLSLRVTQDQLEIISTLNKMYREKSPVLIWQNVGDSRVMRNSYIKAIDFSGGLLILSPMTPGTAFDFDKAHTVYIRGNEKSILFKRDGAVLDRRRIVFDIPSEVRMYENRSVPRNKLGHDSPYQALIEKKVNNTSRKFKEFEFSIFDLSVVGASFNFSPKEQIFFSQGDNFFVTRMGSINFKIPIEAEVVYVKKIEVMTSGHRISRMRMGVKFKRSISQDVVGSFK